MRRLLAFTLCLPSAALADQIDIYAPIKMVTVHPQGAWITRQVEVDIPAGEHVLSLPANFEVVEGLDLLEVSGVQKGATWMTEQDRAFPEMMESAAVTQARADLKQAEEAQKRVLDQRADLLLPSTDAQARLRFIERLGADDGSASLDADTLKALIDVIGVESRAATKMSAAAQIAARVLDEDVAQAEEAVAAAQDALNKLIAGDGGRIVSTKITAAEAVRATVTQRYFENNVEWAPLYEFHLDDGDSPSLTVTRNIVISQEGFEAWRDVELVVTSAAPLSQSEPTQVWEQLRRIHKPEPVLKRELSAVADSMMAESVIEAPVVMEVAGGGGFDYDGTVVTYPYPERISLDLAGETTVPLPPITLDAEIFAQANPTRDETAFLMASFVNASGQPLIGNEGEASMFLNGAFVGQSRFDTIAPGQEEVFAFGPIDGLRVERTVLDDNSGDRGILRGRHIQSQKVRFDVENFTPKSWDLRLFGQVPFSAQEDLEIEWSATPAPDVENADNKRGVLRWDLTMAPGAKAAIELEHQLTWPEGYILR